MRVSDDQLRKVMMHTVDGQQFSMATELLDARARIAVLKAEVRAERKLLATDGTARLEQETSGFYQEELDYQIARAAVGEVPDAPL